MWRLELRLGSALALELGLAQAREMMLILGLGYEKALLGVGRP